MIVAGLLAATIALAGVPERLPGFVISEDDYPAFARRYDHTGVVRFTLQVDAAGIPHNCVVDVSSTFAELDAKTCEIVEARMRFVPARNGHGDATISTYSGHIRWKLDGSEPVSFGDGTAIETYSVTPAGLTAHCTLETSGVMARPAGTPCEVLPAKLLPLVFGGPLTGFTSATIVTLLRVGEMVAKPNRNDYGDRHFELTARFTVNADGRVGQCVPDRQVTAASPVVDICTMIFTKQTETVAEFGPGAAQRGTVAIYIYGRPRPDGISPPTVPRGR